MHNNAIAPMNQPAASSYQQEPVPLPDNCLSDFIDFVCNLTKMLCTMGVMLVMSLMVAALMVSCMLLLWFPLAIASNSMIPLQLYGNFAAVTITMGLAAGIFLTVSRIVGYVSTERRLTYVTATINEYAKNARTRSPGDNSVLRAELENIYPANFTGSYVETNQVLMKKTYLDYDDHVSMLDVNIRIVFIDIISIFVNLIAGLIIFVSWPVSNASNDNYTIAFGIWLTTFVGSGVLIAIHMRPFMQARTALIKTYNDILVPSPVE